MGGCHTTAARQCTPQCLNATQTRWFCLFSHALERRLFNNGSRNTNDVIHGLQANLLHVTCNLKQISTKKQVALSTDLDVICNIGVI